MIVNRRVWVVGRRLPGDLFETRSVLLQPVSALTRANLEKFGDFIEIETEVSFEVPDEEVGNDRE